MPWNIQKKNGKYLVVSQTTGRVAGAHPTEEQARQQQKALYANVPESRRK